MSTDNKIEVFLWTNAGTYADCNYTGSAGSWPYGSQLAKNLSECPDINLTCIVTGGTLAQSFDPISWQLVADVTAQLRSYGITAIPSGTCLVAGYESYYPDMDGTDYFSWFRKTNWDRMIPQLQYIASLRAPGDPRLSLNLEFEGETYYDATHSAYPKLDHVDGPCGDPENNISLREAMSDFVSALADLEPELLLLPGGWDPRSYNSNYPLWGYGHSYTPCKVILEGVQNQYRHSGLIEVYQTYLYGVDNNWAKSMWDINIKGPRQAYAAQGYDCIPGFAAYALHKRDYIFDAMKTRGERKVWFFPDEVPSKASLWERPGSTGPWKYKTPFETVYSSAGGPPTGFNHAIVYDETRKRTLYFTESTYDAYGLTTWEFDGSDWTEQNTGDVIKPSARTSFGICYDSTNSRVLLYGGISLAGTYLKDMWARDSSGNWSEITETSPWPGTRANHLFVWDNNTNVLVLWGGYSGSSFPSQTWHWNGSAWTSLSLSCPSGRQHLFGVFDSDRKIIVAFGGTYGSTYYNQTWEYNAATTTWTQKNPTHNPEARIWHKMAFNSSTNRTILFGGMGIVGGLRQWYDHTWRYDGTDWTDIAGDDTNPVPYHGGGIVYDSNNDKILWIGSDQNREMFKPYWWVSGGWGATGIYLNVPKYSLENKFCLATVEQDEAAIIPHSTHSHLNFNPAVDTFSIALWFRSRDFGGDNGFLIGKRYAGLSNQNVFYVSQWNGVFTLRFGNGSDYSVGTSIPDGNAAPLINDLKWHFLVVTHTPSNRYLYIDGIKYGLTGGSLGTSFTNDADWVVSSVRNTNNTDLAASTCGGFYDEVAFWSSELSANEIITLYNDGVPIDLNSDSGNYTSSTNLLAWFRMGDATGDIVNGLATAIVDESSYQSNGALENCSFAAMSDRNFCWNTPKHSVQVNENNHFEVDGQEFLPISYMRFHHSPVSGISELYGNMSLTSDHDADSFTASLSASDGIWVTSAATETSSIAGQTPSAVQRQNFIPNQIATRLTDEPWDNMVRNKSFTYRSSITGASGSCCIGPSGSNYVVYLSKLDSSSNSVDTWLSNFNTYRLIQIQQNYTPQMRVTKAGATGFYKLYNLSTSYSGYGVTGPTQVGGTGRHMFLGSLVSSTVTLNNGDSVFVTFPIKYQLQTERYLRSQGNAFYRLAQITPGWDSGTLDKYYYNPSQPEAYGDYFGNAEPYVDWTSAQIGYIGVYNTNPRKLGAEYIVSNMRKGASGWQKPIVAQLKMESYDPSLYRAKASYHTVEQQRAIAYSCLLSGCQGIEIYPFQTVYGTQQSFEPYANAVNLDNESRSEFRENMFAMTNSLVQRSDIFLSPVHSSLNVSMSTSATGMFCQTYDVNGTPTIVSCNLEEKYNDYFGRYQSGIYKAKVQLQSQDPQSQASPGDDMYRFAYEAGTGQPSAKSIRIAAGHIYVDDTSTDPTTGTLNDPDTWSDKDVSYWLDDFATGGILRISAASDFSTTRYYRIISVTDNSTYYDIAVDEISSSGSLVTGIAITLGYGATVMPQSSWHYSLQAGSTGPKNPGEIVKETAASTIFRVDLYDKENNDRSAWLAAIKANDYFHLYEYTSPYYDTYEYYTVSSNTLVTGGSRTYYQLVTTRRYYSAAALSGDIYISNAGPSSLLHTTRRDISVNAGTVAFSWNDNYVLHDSTINYAPATVFDTVILHELYVASNSTTINVSVFADNDHDFMTETKITDASVVLSAGYYPTYGIDLDQSFLADHTKYYFIVITADKTASIASKSTTWSGGVAKSASELRSAGIHSPTFTNLDPLWKGISTNATFTLGASGINLADFNTLLVYHNDSLVPDIYPYAGATEIQNTYDPYEVVIYQLTYTQPLWTFDQFVYYADYFALLAKAGVQSSQALYKSIAVVKAIDPSTFVNFDTGVAAQGELKLSLRTAYERIFSNMTSTHPLQGPFMALSEYIRVKSGGSVDEYLTEHKETVMPTYASISTLFDEPISEENVEERWL